MFKEAFVLFFESAFAKIISECVPDLAGSVVYYEFKAIVFKRASETTSPTLNYLAFNEFSTF
tara:strand:+ start:308 stop:493 length:186 start_codon:yes stop_codon:yes gene_type:complete